MDIKMKLQLKFNRAIDLEKDYICPGKYEMTMNGKKVEFDFNTSYRSVNENDSSICDFELEDPDYNEFPDFKDITADDLQNISSIEECFVYTGEEGESDLKLKTIKNITFIVFDKELQIIEIPQHIIKSYLEKIKG